MWRRVGSGSPTVPVSVQRSQAKTGASPSGCDKGRDKGTQKVYKGSRSRAAAFLDRQRLPAGTGILETMVNVYMYMYMYMYM